MKSAREVESLLRISRDYNLQKADAYRKELEAHPTWEGHKLMLDFHEIRMAAFQDALELVKEIQ